MFPSLHQAGENPPRFPAGLGVVQLGCAKSVNGASKGHQPTNR